MFSDNLEFRKSAESFFSLDEVSYDLVSKLEEHRELVLALDSWILSPDHNLLPKLKKLRDVVVELYGDKHEYTLYRGFGINAYQTTLDLPMRRGFFRRIAAKSGDVFDVEITQPVSFTTEKMMAERFGEHIISLKSCDVTKVGLPITKELCYLVAKERNLVRDGLVPSQAEVIMFPGTKVQLTYL